MLILPDHRQFLGSKIFKGRHPGKERIDHTHGLSGDRQDRSKVLRHPSFASIDNPSGENCYARLHVVTLNDCQLCFFLF